MCRYKSRHAHTNESESHMAIKLTFTDNTQTHLVNLRGLLGSYLSRQIDIDSGCEIGSSCDVRALNAEWHRTPVGQGATQSRKKSRQWMSYVWRWFVTRDDMTEMFEWNVALMRSGVNLRFMHPALAAVWGREHVQHVFLLGQSLCCQTLMGWVRDQIYSPPTHSLTHSIVSPARSLTRSLTHSLTRGV